MKLHHVLYAVHKKWKRVIEEWTWHRHIRLLLAATLNTSLSKRMGVVVINMSFLKFFLRKTVTSACPNCILSIINTPYHKFKFNKLLHCTYFCSSIKQRPSILLACGEHRNIVTARYSYLQCSKQYICVVNSYV